jgi:hypothetical protein
MDARAMNGIPRWVIAVVVLLIVVALVAFARGRDHRRGDEIGALGGVRAGFVSTA